MPTLKKSPRKKKNTGRLSKPILLDVPPQSPSELRTLLFPEAKELYEEEKSAWYKQVMEQLTKERVVKLRLLLAKYKISEDDPNRWFLLSRNLAMEYVPGFRVQLRGQVGRDIEWDDILLAHLYRAVHDWLRQSGRTKITEACNALAKKAPWQSMGSAKTLYNNYLKSKKTPFIFMIEKIPLMPEGISFAEEMWASFIARNPLEKYTLK